ncbi:condensin-2 complex subunit H2 [Raphidocelis subcapitata]|uniref:Condensin-2 complex subunit H2 n=1 Tax=Raphidocelis subcapitata TaxID=307507 RepID=A0A2V0P1F8_9CHLO|nr:condensin-2 complex subunit H2 [Raphidocelis subcapitata]|eukprot:GBF92762.1 condensin-2 complex subunit H2 [Raphidocelis subcapitata]
MATAGEDPADAELRENRFAYLLQPIRDLAANWDIDIAAELEEYLEELEGITFAIEDCGPSLNFAEAALLIQGTTCVYSKKVEYLHNLVFRALETIHSKKQRERAAAEGDAKGRGRQAGGDDLDEAFLALDEVARGQVAGEGDIDLDDSEDGDEGPAELLRPPTTLLALEDAAAGQGETDAGSYRLAQCAVHESGALLLEMRDGAAYDRQLRARTRAAATASGTAASAAAPAAPAVGGGPAGAEADAGAAAGLAAAAPAEAFDDFDDDGGGAWDCGSDGDGIDMDDGLAPPLGPVAADDAAFEGGGAFLPDDAFAPVEDNPAAADAELAAGQEPGVGVAVRQRRGGAAGGGVVRRGGAEPFDPYRPLDPNDKGGLLVKPLQVRKPKRRPVRAGEPTEAGAAPTSAPGGLHNAAEFGYLAEALEVARRAIAAAAARQRRGPQRSRAAGAAAAAGLLQRPTGRAVMDWSDIATAEAEEADALLGPAPGDADAAAAFADDDWGGGDPWAGGDDSDGDAGPDAPLEGPSALQAALEEAAGGGGKLGAGWLDAAADGGAGLGAADPSRLTYEELCRAHIDKLIAAAAAQQVQSDLQVRVSTWRQRIDPVLNAEEDRSAFDIHDYGGAILGRLGSGSDANNGGASGSSDAPEAAVPFQRVVACDNRFEVARLFAAMLQLVNNRNVELCKSDPQNPSQPFALQLLSTDRHHEIMGERIAATNANAGTQPGAGAGPGPSASPEPKAPGRQRGKAAAKKAAAGSDSDGLDGASSSDGGGSSDEENRGRRRHQQQRKKAAAAKKPAAKPAAKRARKGGARAQAVA